MSANIETMFYVREKPWHGLGTEVKEAPTSTDALVCAGLNWEVIQKDVYTEDGALVSGYKANLRSTDSAALCIVSGPTRWCKTRMLFGSPTICWVLA